MVDMRRIRELIALLEETKLHKLHVKEKDFEVMIEKEASLPEAITHSPKTQTTQQQQSSQETEEEKQYILSPMVGTFYASPAADQSCFVKKGDYVQEDTVVCIIEAMKVMNEVKAGCKGIIKEILVDNTEVVEFGTKLFLVE